MLYHAGLARTYDLLPFDTTQAPFFSNANVPANYTATNTTAAHEQDRRRRTSLPKDKEVIASMHLVRIQQIACLTLSFPPIFDQARGTQLC